MYQARVVSRTATAVVVEFPLWDATAITRVKSGISFAAGDCKTYKIDTYGGTTWTDNGNVTPVAISGPPGMYRVSLDAGWIGKESTLIQVIDQDGPVWIDEYIRLQTFGDPGASVTYQSDIGSTYPVVNTFQVSGSTAAADKLKDFCNLFESGSVDASPAPTVTSFNPVTDLDGSEDAYLNRAVVFFGPNDSYGITAFIQGFDETPGAQIITHSEVPVLTVSGTEFMILP